jgi:hypothetical protein
MELNRWALHFNPLKPSGNYMSQLSEQAVKLYFVFMGFVWGFHSKQRLFP